jgi:hypothetical protein
MPQRAERISFVAIGSPLHGCVVHRLQALPDRQQSAYHTREWSTTTAGVSSG